MNIIISIIMIVLLIATIVITLYSIKLLNIITENVYEVYMALFGIYNKEYHINLDEYCRYVIMKEISEEEINNEEE